MSSFYRQQLESWLKTMDIKADKVLDVGGSANPVQKRVKSWEVEEYRILDNEGEKDYHDKWFLPNFKEDLNKEAWVKENFDIVFCLEVFEYIWNPVMAMKNIYELTKSGGIAHISFPSIYPVHQPIEVDYLRYTKNGIKKLLDEAGFKEYDIMPRIATAGVTMLGNFYSHERMRAVKNNSVIYDIGYLVTAKK